MTVIAAKIEKDGIYFAADQQTSCGSVKSSDKEINLSKIYQVNNITFGSSGYKSTSLWLLFFAKNHSPLDATEVDIAEFMLEFNEYMKKKDSSFTNTNQFLIAYKNKLFKIWGALDVFEVTSFAAIGSGGDFATAAMYLDRKPDEAVYIASKLDLYCGGIIDTLVHKFTDA